ncbi:hypothetical protein KI387_026165, partial [Taxus chinensis]
IFGDSELVINQVINFNVCKNPLMNSYRHRVSDLMEDFKAINIQSIPRIENKHADRLAVIGASFEVLEQIENKKIQPHIKLIFRPLIPDNDLN